MTEMMNRGLRNLAVVWTFLLLLPSISLIAQGGPGGPGGPGGGLPPVMAPPQNPTTPAKAVLGKALFWDEQLSSDNSMACGSCHFPEAGGTDPILGLHPGLDGVLGTADDKLASLGMRRSDLDNDYLDDVTFGFERQVTGRTAPTMINAAFAPSLFWDGRAGGTFRDPVTNAVLIPGGAALESQAAGPVVSDAEMAHDARMWIDAAAKLQVVEPLKLASELTPDLSAALAGNPSYGDLFLAAFGTPGISAARVAMAIAAYERTLISDQTPFDAFLAGNMNALTPNQRMGLMDFNGPGRCNVCHAGPMTTNHGFRNVGLRPFGEDEGRFEVTGNPADLGRFKVPQLRNVALKSSFFHNGQEQSLADVVDFYARGGDFAANRDPVMGQIMLSPPQRNRIVDFLTNGLTDQRVAQGLAPFDRPTLASESGETGLEVVGTGVIGSGGAQATLIASSPANLGNIDFKLGVHGILGGTEVSFVFHPATGYPGMVFGGLPVHVDFAAAGLEILTRPAEGFGAGAGHSTYRISIPNDPGLSGASFQAQWFAYDTGSAAAIDYVASEGLTVTLF